MHRTTRGTETSRGHWPRWRKLLLGVCLLLLAGHVTVWLLVPKKYEVGGVTYVVGPAVFAVVEQGQWNGEPFFRYTTESLAVDVRGGTLVVNGRHYGQAEVGDVVRFFSDGSVCVNGNERTEMQERQTTTDD